MMRADKKVKNFIISILISILIVPSMISMLPTFFIKAEASVSGEVNVIVSQTHAYIEPDTNSETILDLDVGSTVFVTGEEGDFYVIYYKDMTGYVPKYAIDGTDASSVTGVSTNPDAATLASSAKKAIEETNKAVDQELKDQESYNEVVEGLLEQQKKARRNTIIWVSVMAVLAVGMIAASIITVIKNK